MKAIMDEDKVIKLLDSQIRNSYGNVFWTHKIHEKDADIYRCWNNWIKIAQIVLSAISTTGIIFILFGVSQNMPLRDGQYDCVRWAALISSGISALLVIANSLAKGYDLGELSASHGATALKLLDLREEYLSLLYDIKAKSINVEEIQERRDELKERTLSVYANAPRTTSRGYGKASKAIENREPFFSKESLNKILPQNLQE